MATSRPNNQLFEEIKNSIDRFNPSIVYGHITFIDLYNKISKGIDDHNEDLKHVMEDFVEYLKDEGLVQNTLMRAVNVTASYHDNVDLALYYCPSKRGYSYTDYLGLCNTNSIRQVGKISKMFNLVSIQNNDLNVEWITCENNQFILTEQEKHRVLESIRRASMYAEHWDISSNHTFFIIDHFCPTNYERHNQNAFQKSKIFNLEDVLGIESAATLTCEEIAAMLNGLVW